jgi:hypothetical protein
MLSPTIGGPALAKDFLKEVFDPSRFLKSTRVQARLDLKKNRFQNPDL